MRFSAAGVSVACPASDIVPRGSLADMLYRVEAYGRARAVGDHHCSLNAKKLYRLYKEERLTVRTFESKPKTDSQSEARQVMNLERFHFL